MIHYLIDGNNFIGKAKSLLRSSKNKKADQREQLVLLLDRHYYGRNCKIFLYFDGFMADAIRSHKIKIIYSQKETADSIIKQDISMAKNPKNLIVVSSDLEIYDFARACSCTVKTSEEFYSEVEKKFTLDNEEKPVTSQSEIDYYKKLFGA